MTPNREESQLSRVELIVLACLSQARAPNEAALAEAVLDYCMPGESLPKARTAASDALGRLQRRALVRSGGEARADKRGARLAPTDEGARVLRAALGLAHTPTWSEVRSTHLVALALGIAPNSGDAAAVAERETLVPLVLSARLAREAAPSTAALCDALIAEELRLPPGPLTLNRIRALLLARHAACDVKLPPPVRGSNKDLGVKELETFAARVAADIVEAAKADRRSLAKVLVRRWASDTSNAVTRPGYKVIGPAPDLSTVARITLQPPPGRAIEAGQQKFVLDGERNPKASGPSSAPTRDTIIEAPPKPAETKPAETKPAETKPASLLDIVREAIPRVGADGRFGTEKVFVSAIWDHLDRARRPADLSFDAFKRWLVSESRNGSLQLARADVVGAMNPKLVAASEIQDRGATFHFVLDPRNGAPASRRSHV